MKNFLQFFIFIIGFYLIVGQMLIEKVQKFSHQRTEFLTELQEKKEDFLKQKASKEQAFIEKFRNFSFKHNDRDSKELREKIEAIGKEKKQSFEAGIKNFSQNQLEREEKINCMRQKRDEKWEEDQKNFFKFRLKERFNLRNS
jgi:hypothetical protein